MSFDSNLWRVAWKYINIVNVFVTVKQKIVVNLAIFELWRFDSQVWPSLVAAIHNNISYASIEQQGR